MATLTAHFNMKKPTLDGDENLWGEFLNQDLDTLDALLWDTVYKTTGTPQVMTNRLYVPPAPSVPSGGAEMEPERAANIAWVEYRIRAFLNQFIPIGMIMMWRGNFENIPAGWLICDGTNGTPNMLGRVIIAAANVVGIQPGASGGVVSGNPLGHIHATVAGATAGPVGVVQGTAANTPIWNGGAATPPFFAVVFIMKSANWV